MRKVRHGLAGLVVVLPAVWMLAHAAATIPDEITIDDCQSKQPAVKFSHKLHTAKTDCATCHHTQKDLTADKASEAKACDSCHNAPEKAETPKCSEMSLTKNPYHIACINCHKQELKKNAQANAPTKCTDCHVKAG